MCAKKSKLPDRELSLYPRPDMILGDFSVCLWFICDLQEKNMYDKPFERPQLVGGNTYGNNSTKTIGSRVVAQVMAALIYGSDEFHYDHQCRIVPRFGGGGAIAKVFRFHKLIFFSSAMFGV